MAKDIELIISEIKSHYGFKKDTEVAKLLEITPQTLSNWVTRNSIDYDLVYTKCVGISGDFLLGGKLPAFKTGSETYNIVEITPEFLLKRYEELVIQNNELKRIIEDKKGRMHYMQQDKQTLVAAEPQTKLNK